MVATATVNLAHAHNKLSLNKSPRSAVDKDTVDERASQSKTKSDFNPVEEDTNKISGHKSSTMSSTDCVRGINNFTTELIRNSDEASDANITTTESLSNVSQLPNKQETIKSWTDEDWNSTPTGLELASITPIR